MPYDARKGWRPKYYPPLSLNSVFTFCGKIVFYKLLKIDKCGRNIIFAGEG